MLVCAFSGKHQRGARRHAAFIRPSGAKKAKVFVVCARRVVVNVCLWNAHGEEHRANR